MAEEAYIMWPRSLYYVAEKHMLGYDVCIMIKA